MDYSSVMDFGLYDSRLVVDGSTSWRRKTTTG